MRADRIDPAERMNQFAELLSLDIAMKDIAVRMGIKRVITYAMLKKLRAKYGWQSA